MQMYYVAIVLPEELNRKIHPFKEWMRERFGCLVGLKSPAHITLLPPFWMDPAREPDFSADLDAFARTQAPIPVTALGFSAFKPRTLFIDVVADEPLRALKAACDHWFEARPQYGIRIDRRPFHPHITIATRDLPRGSFAEAWAHFEGLRFQETWTADAATILKHNGKGWDVWTAAPFGNRES
ncbi:2'-5' RNA ligase family protein [Flaviaesturariibacter terrae]